MDIVGGNHLGGKRGLARKEFPFYFMLAFF